MCMHAEYKVVKYHVHGAVAYITMNSPQSMNALDRTMIYELTEAFGEASEDPAVKVVVLTGAGKAFCAGGDISGFTQLDLAGGVELVQEGGALAKAMLNSPKIIISSVNGYAMGAGLSLALLSDMVVASDKAKFGAAFISIGLVPDMAALYFLPRVVGLQKAKEISLTGNSFSAEEAHRLGIVNTLAEHDRLVEETGELAVSLAEKPGDAMASIKSLLNKGMDMNVDALLEMEALAQGVRIVSDNAREGADAFLNKRAPVFK